MKDVMKISLLILVIGIAMSGISFAAEDFTSGDHATLASLYESKAAEQQSLVSQHERMKTDSDVRRRNQSATAMKEMETHCDGIIATAKTLKKELLNFAEWHKKQVTQ